MREIKFRAWDKITKSLRGVIRIDFDNQRFNLMLLFPTESAPKNWKLRKFDDVNLMQYTGLKDKNGKEIYEFHEINNRYRVVWKFNKYVLQSISNVDIFTDIIKDNEYEITREYSPIS